MATFSPIAGYPRLTEAENLVRDKDYDAASAIVIQHLREHRDEPRGLALLGEIAMHTGALLQSENFLRRAIVRGASNYEVLKSLATNILRQDRLDEGLEAFANLERRFPDPQLTATKAMILDRFGRSEEALRVQEQLLATEPNEPKYWIAHGHTLRFVGRTDEAVAAYRRAVKIDPEHGESWWALADIKSRVLTDADLATMEKELAGAVDVLNVAPLHMAVGRALHDRGQFERAFGHYREGNTLRSKLLDYDPEQLTLEVEAFMRMATPKSFEAAGAEGHGSIPVFLVSLPRAGSTLLEQILGQHPLIEPIGELPYIRALLRNALEVRMMRGTMDTPRLIASLPGDEKKALGAEYLRRAAQHRATDAPFFIDKMPTNWVDILFIREILPQARFIDIRRNAMDCCFSNYTHHFASAHPSSFDLVHQARCYSDYARLMNHIARAAPGFLCSIRYEELIEDPEPVLRSALDYLGLEWDDGLLHFYESDRSIRTPSAEQVRQPLNRKGIGMRKPYA